MSAIHQKINADVHHLKTDFDFPSPGVFFQHCLNLYRQNIITGIFVVPTIQSRATRITIADVRIHGNALLAKDLLVA